MIKKLAIGIIGLGVIGGAAWAGGQYFGGPVSDQTKAQSQQQDEEDDEKLILRDPGDGSAITADEPGGPGDPPTAGSRRPLEAGSVSLPHLRAGLWRVKKTDNNGMVTESSMCLNEAVQEKVSVFGGAMTGAFCPPSELARSGQAWTVTGVCPILDVGRLTVNGRISGDMRTRYRTEYVMTSTAMGQTSTDRSLEEGVYGGRCPSDMAPGDIIMPGGVRITFDQVMALGQMAIPGAMGPPEGFTPAPSR